MKILQFKRKNSQNNTNSPELTAGEMFVFPSEEKIRIGKQEGTPTSATGTYFEIKSKLNLGDTVYNANGTPSEYSLGQAFVGISGSGTNFNLVRMNGQQVPLNVTISTTAEYAKKLVTNGSSTITEGSSTRPVYFNNGVPAVVSSIGDSSWKPSITASSVNSTEYYTKKQLLYNKVLATDQYGQFTSAGSKGSNSTPIWIDNGVFKECTGLTFAKFSQISTNKTIKSTSATTQTTLSSLGITSGGYYMVMGVYNNVYYNFWILIGSVSSGLSISTSSQYYSGAADESKNICIYKSGANIAVKCPGTSASSQMDDVTIYKLQ